LHFRHFDKYVYAIIKIISLIILLQFCDLTGNFYLVRSIELEHVYYMHAATVNIYFEELNYFKIPFIDLINKCTTIYQTMLRMYIFSSFGWFWFKGFSPIL